VAKKTSKPSKRKAAKKVLLFGGGKMGGGAHDHSLCCPILERCIRSATGFQIDYVAEDYDAFLAERLRPYDVLVLYHTGQQLTPDQKHGLVEWVASGKGFVGLHGASCSFHDSPEYFAMLGGRFRGHPCVREYIVSVNDTAHPVTRDLKGYAAKHWEPWPVYEYKVLDEQYLMDYDNRVHVLASTVFRGRTWPVAWVQPWGQGKVFYNALGHTAEACRNPFFKQMLIGAVKWAVNRRPDPDYRKGLFAIS